MGSNLLGYWRSARLWTMIQGMSSVPLRLAVLISGGGRTLLNLHKHITDGALDARIEVVVSSRADAMGVERSRRTGLNTVVVDRRTLSNGDFQDGVTQAVADVDLVCMAGFLLLWQIPDEFHGRVINIHPALLPDFGGRGLYGRRVHQAVLAAGKKVSGCTVHFCDNQYDHGPIILQRKVSVLPDDTLDTLAARVFEQECIAYPQAVRLFADGRIVLEQNRVRILTP
jgi:formyltetrahydrofolate-dependent phosphoribosylglycinamide formyltransferase